jgi:hypothetical protein
MLIAALLAVATVLAVAAPGALGGDTAPGDEGHLDGGGAVSSRAVAVAPAPGHEVALRAAFARRHRIAVAAAPQPRRLREARHRGLLWALATFARADGSVVSERFTWRRATGWRDLGATRAACPAVPPEVRGAWRLPSACQTS